jgi:hypothetical protein
MRWLVGLVAALVLWTAMAWVWVAVSGNAHVCSILAASVGEPELTSAEQLELTRERCRPRASVADIVVFGTGYVVILAVFGVFAARAGSPPDDSRNDPLVPGA